MNVKIIPSLSSRPSSEQLRSLERELGIKFPSDYVEFLLEYGAGEPGYNVHRSDQRVSVTRFLAMDGQNNSAQGLIRRYAGRIPESYMPIADVAGGNLILLHTKDNSIHFWDHELEAFEEDINANNKATSKLATSFSEFLKELIPMPKVPPQEARVVSVKLDPEFAKKFGLKKPEK